jgi:hypothetical protein
MKTEKTNAKTNAEITALKGFFKLNSLAYM